MTCALHGNDANRIDHDGIAADFDRYIFADGFDPADRGGRSGRVGNGVRARKHRENDGANLRVTFGALGHPAGLRDDGFDAGVGRFHGLQPVLPESVADVKAAVLQPKRFNLSDGGRSRSRAGLRGCGTVRRRSD